jgi:hypothetical protein
MFKSRAVAGAPLPGWIAVDLSVDKAVSPGLSFQAAGRAARMCRFSPVLKT